LSHEIDYLRWIFGEVEWVSAILRKQSRLDIDVEDSAYLTLGFAAGSGTVPGIASLVMDFVRHDTVRTCTVIGEVGTLRWNALTGTVDIFREGATGWEMLLTSPDQRDDTYVAEWHQFLECMQGDATPVNSGQDGLAVLRIIQAARESSLRREVVPVAAVIMTGIAAEEGLA
jgi:predicted dehydrogenase